MAINVKQSAIKEVRDQLSLDYADGKYLGRISANLGFNKPKVGFSDAEWRAITKAVALNYKQIKTKFEEVLAIMLGPRVTCTSSLTEDSEVGQQVVKVIDHSNWPQTGTVIFDEGLPTEESIHYGLIDRYRNELYLDEGLAFPHVAVNRVTSALFITQDFVGASKIVVDDIFSFPDPSDVGNYTITVGAGTSSEESAVVTSVDYTNKVIQLLNPLVNVHNHTTPSNVHSYIKRSYNTPHPVTTNIQLQGVAYITVQETTNFPDTGTLLLGPVGPGVSPSNNKFTVTSGTTTSVNVAALSLRQGSCSGYILVFSPSTATAALRNKSAFIISNSTSQFVLDRALSVAPSSGDTFQVRPILRYTGLDRDTNSINISEPIFDVIVEGEPVLVSSTVTSGSTTTVVPVAASLTSDNSYKNRLVYIGLEKRTIVSHTVGAITVSPALSIPPTIGTTVKIVGQTKVELLDPQNKSTGVGETVEVSQLRSPGKGWDVLQSSNNKVEVLVPSSLWDISDIRSASYAHTTHNPSTPTLSVTSTTSIGAEVIYTSDARGFPTAGVARINSAETFGYYIYRSFLTTSFDAGSTVLSVPNSKNFIVSESIIIDPDTAYEETVTVSGVDVVLNTITVTALANDHLDGAKLYTNRLNIPNYSLVSSYPSSTPISLYQPQYPGTDLLDGNLWSVDNVFPGPYVYHSNEITSGGVNLQVPRIPVTLSTVPTRLAHTLPGPAILEINQVAGSTALEVNNAVSFSLSGFPYSAIVGTSTGNKETVLVSSISLRQRVITTVNAGGSPGDTSITVASLGSGLGGFPDAKGYRVIIGRGTANEEVVYVTSTSPNTLHVDAQLINSHSVGEVVELLADVLVVSVLSDSHEGIVPFEYRSSYLAGSLAIWPKIASADIDSAEAVSQVINAISVESTVGFPTDGGFIYLNFGITSNRSLDYTESLTTSSASPGVTFVNVVDPNVFRILPSSPTIVVVDPGGLKEEIVRVLSVTGFALNLETPLRFFHDTSSIVRKVQAKEELIQYSTVSGNTLTFDDFVTLQYAHNPGESIVLASLDSVPDSIGYSFPFHLPPELSFRLQSIMDIIRAAGVNVTFIQKR